MASSQKSETLVFLRERLEEATTGLAQVSQKRLFGCDGFFRNGTIFALVWKDGRIGLKVRDEGRHSSLAAMRGTLPWSPMGEGRAMTHWLLVPESFHDDDEALATWTREAHATAFPTEKKPAKKASANTASAKKASAKKVSAKKVSAKKVSAKKASRAPKKAAR